MESDSDAVGRLVEDLMTTRVLGSQLQPKEAAMSVKARMYVASIERFSYNPAQSVVKFQCVTRGEHNKSWAAATPTGSLSLTINNPEATAVFVDAFEKRQEFELTFEPLDPEPIPG